MEETCVLLLFATAHPIMMHILLFFLLLWLFAPSYLSAEEATIAPYIDSSR